MAYPHAVGDRVLPTHYSGRGRCLEAMFPEHWERGTGTWNVEHRFVKSWYEGVYLFRMFQSEMEHVPSVMGTMFPEHCFGTRNVFQIISAGS